MAFCSNCGQHLNAGMCFCPACGTKVVQPSQPEAVVTPVEEPKPVIVPEPVCAPEVESVKAPAKPKPACPPNYLGKAIAALVLFFPFGIPALVSAIKVNNLYAEERYAEAIFASENASRKGTLGIVFGAVIQGIFLTLLVLADL